MKRRRHLWSSCASWTRTTKGACLDTFQMQSSSCRILGKVSPHLLQHHHGANTSMLALGC